MQKVPMLLVVLALVAPTGCDMLKKGGKKDKRGAAGAKAEKKEHEFASVDLAKVEQLLLNSKAKKFKPWIASLQEDVNQLMPGTKPVSINTTRSRIRTWTPSGNSTQYALNLTAFIETNGQPGWQYGKEPFVFKARIRELGRNTYDFYLTGPDGKIVSKGQRKIDRKNIVAKFIRRKVLRKSGTYHTPEARGKELVALRGKARPAADPMAAEPKAAKPKGAKKSKAKPAKK